MATLLVQWKIYLLLLLAIVYEGSSQSTDGKRKASEYFCVAQCLGLLSSSGPPPGASVCYGGPGGVNCANPSYQQSLSACCKDLPTNIMKDPADKCKSFTVNNQHPIKILTGYVINVAIEANGKFDFTNQEGNLLKKFGKQMCYMDCAFREANLMTNDLINYDAVRSNMQSVVTADYWKSPLENAITVCSGLIKSLYDKLGKIKVADQTCSPQPLIFQQCVRRMLQLACSSSQKLDTPDCKTFENEMKSCDIYARGY